MLINELYHLNNESLDLFIYKTVIPFWKTFAKFEKRMNYSEWDGSFTEYENLSFNVKKIFRDLVYGKCKNLNCTKDEFWELYTFLDFITYNKKEFIPIFSRYFFQKRKDTKFIAETAFIHQNFSFFKKENGTRETDAIKTCKWILGFAPDEKISEEMKKTVREGYEDILELALNPINYVSILQEHYKKEKRSPFLMFYYALISKDTEKSKLIHLRNWEENRYPISYYNYTFHFSEKKSESMLLANWKQNNHLQSLKHYCYILEKNNLKKQKYQKYSAILTNLMKEDS